MGLNLSYMGLKLSYMGPKLTFSKEALVGEEWNTKDSENVCGTEKASEKKTNSENIEALYERLKMRLALEKCTIFHHGMIMGWQCYIMGLSYLQSFIEFEQKLWWFFIQHIFDSVSFFNSLPSL